MKSPSLPTLLSFNAGYVDALGFLSLSGLFTAHVTGNFVTLGATLAHGLDGALSKLLAPLMFCLVVFVSRLVCLKLRSRDRSPIWPMLVVKLLLFVGVAAYALYHGPFRAEEGAVTLAVGMAPVSAMAIQNGLHKAHLSKAPPSTLMTGTTTQIMLDLADGGRQLDGTMSPLSALPEIVARIGNKTTVMVDGGFRRGTDILKALALGARFVFVGRPFLYAAVAAGSPAILKAIDILKSEIHQDMALLGVVALDDIDDCFVVRRDRLA